MAVVLTYPERATQYSMDKLRQRILNGGSVFMVQSFPVLFLWSGAYGPGLCVCDVSMGCCYPRSVFPSSVLLVCVVNQLIVVCNPVIIRSWHCGPGPVAPHAGLVPVYVSVYSHAMWFLICAFRHRVLSQVCT